MSIENVSAVNLTMSLKPVVTRSDNTGNNTNNSYVVFYIFQAKLQKNSAKIGRKR